MRPDAADRAHRSTVGCRITYEWRAPLRSRMRGWRAKSCRCARPCDARERDGRAKTPAQTTVAEYRGVLLGGRERRGRARDAGSPLLMERCGRLPLAVLDDAYCQSMVVSRSRARRLQDRRSAARDRPQCHARLRVTRGRALSNATGQAAPAAEIPRSLRRPRWSRSGRYGLAEVRACELRAGGDLELGEHFAQVIIHRARAEEEVRCHLWVRHSGSHEAGDL